MLCLTIHDRYIEKWDLMLKQKLNPLLTVLDELSDNYNDYSYESIDHIIKFLIKIIINFEEFTNIQYLDFLDTQENELKTLISNLKSNQLPK